MLINLANMVIQPLNSLSTSDIAVDILRMDRVHPELSGNKWFKLQYYLQEAQQSGLNGIASFGGAYSNHIAALAYTGQKINMATIGFIRGDEPAKLSHTLQTAKKYGMELIFIPRDAYRNKAPVWETYQHQPWYWIPEGGAGILGAQGAATILSHYNIKDYTHIVCAAGTGTMMAGLIKSALPHQQVIGVSVLKGNRALSDAVLTLLNAEDKEKTFQCVHDFHFGGYAKTSPELIAFMNQLWLQDQLPTDQVYTAKLLFACKEMILSDYFPPTSKILLIHSGGLQGNCSLPSGTLLY